MEDKPNFETIYRIAGLILDAAEYSKRVEEAQTNAAGLCPFDAMIKQIVGMSFRRGYEAALADVRRLRDSLIKPAPPQAGEKRDG